jgi:hypothetical protein
LLQVVDFLSSQTSGATGYDRELSAQWLQTQELLVALFWYPGHAFMMIAAHIAQNGARGPACTTRWVEFRVSWRHKGKRRLVRNRSQEAVHWNLLTDLKPEQLQYAD